MSIPTILAELGIFKHYKLILNTRKTLLHCVLKTKMTINSVETRPMPFGHYSDVMGMRERGVEKTIGVVRDSSVQQEASR